MARGLNLSLENLEEIRKLDRNKDHFLQGSANLEQRAVQNGIKVLRKAEDKPPTAFGEPRREDVRLFAHYIETAHEDSESTVPIGEALYRHLSAHVHSMIWVKLSQAEATSTDEPGMQSVKLVLEFDWLAGMLLMVLRLHERNIASLLGLSGYPVMVWEEAKKTAVADARERLRTLGERQHGG